MAFDFFLNELSYRQTAKDIHEARENMSRFVRVLSRLRKQTKAMPIAAQLRMDENFQNALLAPGYSVAKWRGDRVVDQIERLFFKTYSAQAPYLTNLPQEATADFPDVYGYYFEQFDANGLGFAHLLRGISVSLSTEDCWDRPAIQVDVDYLTEDAHQRFATAIPHCATDAHVEANAEFLAHRVNEEIEPPRTLLDIWDQRGRLFPSLNFCEQVRDQLKDLQPVQHLAGVLSTLLDMDRYSQQWMNTGADFDLRGMLHVTAESAGRIEEFGHLMTFDWNGAARLFSFHGRFTPGAGRIHIWPDLAERRIVVGYIGMKIGI